MRLRDQAPESTLPLEGEDLYWMLLCILGIPTTKHRVGATNLSGRILYFNNHGFERVLEQAVWTDSKDTQVTKTLSLLVRNVRRDRDQTEKQVSQRSSGLATWRGVGGCVTRGKAISLSFEEFGLTSG